MACGIYDEWSGYVARNILNQHLAAYRFSTQVSNYIFKLSQRG